MLAASLKVSPLPVADWDESLARVLADMQGQPLNVHALMAHHPELLKAWWNFRNHSVAGGALGGRSGELVILRVAVHMKSWYEWASHVVRALSCGLSLAEIERSRQGPQAPGWAPADALLLQAVDELMTDHAIAASTLAKLASHYDARQVMDLIAIQGMYVILGCMLNTWGLELDGRVRDKLPAGITREQFETGPDKDRITTSP
jgi:alkylhydroperoxidase family enzyme